MDPFWVRITNWDKHNPRKDIKKPTWFAFDNRMVEDEDLFDLTHGEFKAWVYLLSKASQKVSDVIRISPEHALRVCKISNEELASAIKKFSDPDLNMISLDVTRTEIERARNVDVRDQYATDRQDRTDTTGQDRGRQDAGAAEPPDSSFEVNERLKDDLLNPILCFVSSDIQELWIKEFCDVQWIKKTLRKTVMKKMAQKTQPKASDWAGILTSWLCTEKDRPAISKETREWENPDQPMSRDESIAIFEKHFKALGVKQSLTEFLGKKKTA